MIDRELYLTQGWLADAERCRGARPARLCDQAQLARVLLQRALEAGVPAGWVTADEVYGGDPALRGWLEAHELPYVLAVKCTEPLPPPSGPPTPAARLAEHVPPACWLRISAGQGAKGRCWYAWSRLALDSVGAPPGWGRWLLLRRSLTTGELAYYVCAGPAGMPPGPAPGPPLGLLVPVGDPGHAGLRLPGGGRGHRARHERSASPRQSGSLSAMAARVVEVTEALLGAVAGVAVGSLWEHCSASCRRLKATHQFT